MSSVVRISSAADRFAATLPLSYGTSFLSINSSLLITLFMSTRSWLIII